MGFGLRFPIFGHVFSKQIFPMLLKKYSDFGGGKNKII
jgi:hypothetical protein